MDGSSSRLTGLQSAFGLADVLAQTWAPEDTS